MKPSFCILFLLVSLSTNLLAASSDQNATQTVYVYRPSDFSLWGRTVVVSVNGIASTELTSCTFSKLKLPSGVYRFDVAVKPWPFDRSTEGASITVNVASDKPTYIGYYPNWLSAAEISATFISYPDIKKGSYPRFFGIAYPEVATKEMVSCSAVKSLNE